MAEITIQYNKTEKGYDNAKNTKKRKSKTTSLYQFVDHISQ